MTGTNYIQIKIGPLKVGEDGKEIPDSNIRGWKVNQMTIEIWGKMIDEMAYNASSNYGAVYGGLVANCYAKQVDPDFTYENVCDWVDQLQETGDPDKTMEKVKDAFESSQLFIKLIEKSAANLKTKAQGDDKKKAAHRKK